MQERDVQWRELGLDFLVGRDGGSQPGLRLLDDRAYPIGLLPFGARLADPFQNFRALVFREHPGLDRVPPGRQLVDGGDVEVGEISHRERAGDGRRAHHELVWYDHARFLAQREALLDAEAVLLVDYHEPEARERRILLDERVRTDQ